MNAILTIDDHCSRGATPLSNDVLSDACVVSGVGKPCLFDDQVMIDGDVEITIVCRIDNLFVLQPFHLHVDRDT